MRKQVFISYRRAQATKDAQMSAQYLRRILPDNFVFLDEASIESGSDFPARLESAINQCEIMLVLMGPNWSQLRDAAGHQRLADTSDFVRIEVERALAQRKTVVPILLDGAQMPEADTLPPSLRALTTKQALMSPSDNVKLALDRTILDLRISVLEIDSIIELLQKYQVVAEWYPNMRRKTERIYENCTLFPYEQIAGMLDLTISGDGRHFLAFSTAGMYHKSIGTDKRSSFKAFGRIGTVGLDERTSTLILDHEGWNIAGTMEDTALALVTEVLRLFERQ